MATPIALYYLILFSLLQYSDAYFILMSEIGVYI